MGELPLILFIISKFLWECNLNSFEPRFFSGALTNDNVGAMKLRGIDGKILAKHTSI
jgi:hypothetical protein